MTSKQYTCIGENFAHGARMGACGETRTLMGWLVHLTGRSEEFLREYFSGFPDSNVAEYIYTNYGKRLSQRPNRNGQKG